MPSLKPPYILSIPILISMSALSACSAGDDRQSTVTINDAPTANAGADFTAPERTIISLSGSFTDPDSNPSVLWTQVAGLDVEIINPTSTNASFLAPSVPIDQQVRLRMSVNDGSNDVVTDDVIITIENLSIDNRELRSIDGTNNNIANPQWGASHSHLQRLANNDYGDGISTLAGATRPSARIISNNVVNQDDGTSIPNSFNGTDYVWQWGQFIDHDLGLTEGANEVANIAVPLGDMFFDPFHTGTEEIAFTRAIFDPASGTDITNPREQENEITSWIDASMIYGSDATRAAELRVGTDSPLLKTSDNNLLPFNMAGLANANSFGVPDEALFLAGDVRANEQLGLATMHTLFVREHNRMANLLTEEFPDNTPDEVFELTRRLMAAKIQIITYDEWLPALVGSSAITDYTGYDASVNPTLFSEFSGAAFRLGHSMLNEQLLRLDAQGNVIADGNIELANAFFTAPSLLTSETDLDPILRGLANQAHQRLDGKIVSDLRNFLFGAPGAGGLDLASLNIQRGRDHGLPDYNAVRAALGLTVLTSFNEVSSDPDVVTALANTYNTVDDIDLWVGGLAEDATSDSQLGELFQAIIVRQFTDLRNGDRFWYENDLSEDELNLLTDTTLAEIIRLNTNINSEIQDNVFISATPQ